MKTSARRLSTLAIATALASTGLATLNSPAAHAWTGCEGDCVTSVKVTQTLATKATPTLKITTAVPTRVLVTIKDTNGATAGAVSSSSTSYATTHTLNAGAILSQGKGYVVSVKATDQNGKSFTDQSSLKALARTVTLTLKVVTITEDSDYGAGEIRAGVRVNNTAGTVATVFGQRSISATKALTINKTYTFNNVTGDAKVAVELQDDDADLGEFCPNGSGFSFTNGSNSCADWTTAKTTVAALGAIGSATRDFTILGSGRLVFHVTGNYTVKVG